jgi:phage-related minor tail protein
MRESWMASEADKLGISIAQFEGALAASYEKIGEVMEEVPLEVREWLVGVE